MSKLKTANSNDFASFIEMPNKSQMLVFVENNLRRPLIILNPIFDKVINQYAIEPESVNSVPNNASPENLISNANKRHAIISEKISVGFID